MPAGQSRRARRAAAAVEEAAEAGVRVSKKRFIILLIASLSMLAVVATVFFVWVLPAIRRPASICGLWNLQSGEFTNVYHNFDRNIVLEFDESGEFVLYKVENGRYNKEDYGSYSVKDGKITFEFDPGRRSWKYTLEGNKLTIMSSSAAGVFEKMYDPRNEPIKPFDESAARNELSVNNLEVMEMTPTYQDETDRKFRVRMKDNTYDYMKRYYDYDVGFQYDRLEQTWKQYGLTRVEGNIEEEWLITGTWLYKNEYASENDRIVIHSFTISEDGKRMTVDVDYYRAPWQSRNGWNYDEYRYQGTLELHRQEYWIGGPSYKTYSPLNLDISSNSGVHLDSHTFEKQ